MRKNGVYSYNVIKNIQNFVTFVFKIVYTNETLYIYINMYMPVG